MFHVLHVIRRFSHGRLGEEVYAWTRLNDSVDATEFLQGKV